MSKEITNVSIDVLKVHPRNTEFFDDISGKEYEEFKHSIQEEGIISEIIVSPDMTIISGHQRYKAAKELEIKMVPIRIREDLIDEDKKLKVLLAANFGRSKNDDKKQRKIAIEYVRLCGYKNGEIGNGRKKECQNGIPKLTLEEIASQLGTSKRDLQRVLSIERNLTDSMKELLDTGVITKTLASDTIASLSEEEQEELISKLDVTKIYTKKQIQKYIDEINSLKEENEKLKETPQGFDTVSQLKIEKEKLEKENKILESQKRISDDLAAQYKSQSEEYMEVKKKLTHMGLEPDGDYNTFQATVQITELNNDLSELLQNRLAPLKYQPYMFAVKNNELLKKNFINTLSMINDWYSTMLSFIGEESNEENIIDIETEKI